MAQRAVPEETGERRALQEPPAQEVSDRDDTLTVLFMCCHPALTPASAIALTLRAVGGLDDGRDRERVPRRRGDDGAAHLPGEAAVKASGVPFRMPTPDEQGGQRCAASLHVLYLIFNEGYASSAGTTCTGSSSPTRRSG